MLPKHGLVTFTWGNVPGIDREEGATVIKPSGIEYDGMSAEDIILRGLEGSVVEGGLKPSSDLMIHLESRENFPNIGGVMHTHSRWVTALVQAGKVISALGTIQTDYFYGDIPCTKLTSEVRTHGEYELETGHVTVETFKQKGINPDNMSGVLVHSHGPFSWGEGSFKAVHNVVTTEECAVMVFVSMMLQSGSTQPMQQASLDKHFKHKHGSNAYYGQESSS